jgi:ribosome assembly protein YihI (activator of Der GTPase)
VSEVAPAAFDGAPQAQQQQQQQGRFQPVEGHVIEQLKAMIEAHHEPVEEVAQFFADALSTEELKAALNENDGDVNRLVAEHLGLWVMSDDKNREYIARVGEAMDKLLAQLGLVEEEQDEEDGEEAES